MSFPTMTKTSKYDIPNAMWFRGGKKNHRFDEKSKILTRVAENREFLLPLRKLSYKDNEEELEGARTPLERIFYVLFRQKADEATGR